MASITHATLWPNPPEIRAPEGRGTAKSMDITVPSSVDPDRACGLCLAQRTIRTPFHPSTLSILLMRTMHPALFRLAGFQLAVTVLLAIVPVRLFFLKLCMVPLRVNQFIDSLFLRPPSRNRLEGDLALSFKNAIGRFLQDGLKNHATRWFPPLRFYDVANWLTLNRIRDDPNRPTLTSIPFWNPAWEIMSVAVCANLCVDSHTALAGLKNGSACCECTSRRRLPRRHLIFVTSLF